MEIIISRNFSLKKFSDIINIRKINKIEGAQFNYFSLENGIECFYETGAVSSINRPKLSAFYGHLLRRETFISTMAGRVIQAPDILAATEEAIFGSQQDQVGIYVAASLTEDQMIVTTDPLGQLPLYHYKSDCGSKWIICSNPNIISDILASSGSVVNRSLSPCSENICFNTSFGNSSHFEKINRLPMGSRYVFRGHLEITRNPPRNTKGMTYSECIERARSSIYRQLVAIATSGEENEITVDITGGADSRCVLSFLLNSPLRGRFGGRCITRAPNADAVVAQGLMARYNISYGRFPIFLQGKASFSNEIAVRQYGQLFGGARDASAAMPQVSVSNFYHFKGGYGEIGGATPGIDYVTSALENGNVNTDLMVANWLSRRRQSKSIDLITQDAIENASRQLNSELCSLIEEGISPDQLQSELYLRTRSRNHFGMQSYCDMFWKNSPDILSNLWLVEARRRIPSSLHGANKVIFDLIYANDSELAMEALAGKKWDKKILPIDAGSVAQPFVSDPNSTYLYHKVEIKSEFPAGFSPISSGAKSGDTSKFALASNTASYQAIFHYILERFSDSSPIWDTFERNMFIEYSKRSMDDFSSNGQDTNAMGIAASGILAYAGDGLDPHITNTIQMPS